MLEEFIKELEELKEFKKKCEYLEKDKQVLSDKLFEYMTREYEGTSYESRCSAYIKNSCSCCRNCDFGYCSLMRELPQDIGKPVQSDKAWIPATKGCSNFRWS